MTDKLTPKQEAFCRAYLETGNASEAYRRAYNPQKMSAGAIEVEACRLLKNPKVALRVEKKQTQLAERHDITVDKIVAELVKIGFSDIRKLVKWGAHVVQTDDGTPLTGGSNGELVISNSVELLGSEVIDDATAAAVAEISQGQHGIKVKMYDKKSALVDLGKHLGMFVDRVDVTSDNRHTHAAEPLSPFAEFLTGAVASRAKGETEGPVQD